MNYRLTVHTLEHKFFSMEFFDYEQVHFAIFGKDDDFIRIEGSEAEEVFYIPKFNIDFIKIEKL